MLKDIGAKKLSTESSINSSTLGVIGVAAAQRGLAGLPEVRHRKSIVSEITAHIAFDVTSS
jgi:hypothetical protein